MLWLYNLLTRKISPLLLLLAVGCSSGGTGTPDPSTNPSPQIRTLQIRDHRQECTGVAVFPCLYTKDPEDSEWSLFYDSIEGFDYEWGYNYNLTVAVTPVENPLADGSSLRYTLVDIASKTPVAAAAGFLYSSRYATEVITKRTDTLYSLFPFPSKEFVCKQTDCELLDSLLAEGQAVLFDFRHPQVPSDALILEKIVCSSSQALFSETCLQSSADNASRLDVNFSALDKFSQVSTSFNEGETIMFALSVVNKTSASVNLHFTVGHRYDIVVHADNNAEVWRWSGDSLFNQAAGSVELTSMGSVKVIEHWDQRQSDGTAVPAGNYRASAYYHDEAIALETKFSIH